MKANFGGLLKHDVGLEPRSEVIGSARDRQIETFASPRGDRLERFEIGEFIPVALVNGKFGVGLRIGRIDRLEEELRQVASFVVIQMHVGHTSGGSHVVGLFEEQREAIEGILLGEVREWDRRGGQAGTIGVAMAHRAADLFVELLASRDGLGVGAGMLTALSGGFQVGGQCFCCLGPLWFVHAMEQVGHGRPELIAMDIAEHRGDVSSFESASNLFEHRRTFLFEDLAGFSWGMATDAAEFADEESPAELLVGKRAAGGRKAFVTGDSRSSCDLVGIQGNEPDVSIADRIAVVLEIQWSVARAFIDGGCRRGTWNVLIAMDRVTVEPYAQLRVGDFFPVAIPACCGEFDVVGLPLQWG